jgi:hypothetical protein
LEGLTVNADNAHDGVGAFVAESCGRAGIDDIPMAIVKLAARIAIFRNSPAGKRLVGRLMDVSFIHALQDS